MFYKKKIVNKLALRKERIIEHISKLTFRIFGLDKLLHPLKTLMEISQRLENIIKSISEKLIPIKM